MDENLRMLLATSNEDFQNDNFNSEVSTHFMDLHGRKSEFDLDILFNNDKVIPIHKKVLIERCPYFKNMLQSNLKETNSKSVSFTFDVDVGVIETIIWYFYSGTISLNGGNINDICITSSYMQQDDLTKICIDFLMKNISCETAHILLKFAEDNLMHNLVERVMKYIEKHFKNFVNHNSTLQWPYKLVKAVLRSDNIRVSSEAPVLKFLCNWLNAEFSERKEVMDDILYEIRFSFLTNETVSDAINDDVRLKIHQQCFKYMESCLINSIKHRERCYDVIYLFGGLNSNKEHIFERYLPNDNSVRSLTPPFPCSASYRYICLNGNLYLIGGFVPYSNPIEFLNRVQMYDPILNHWSSVAPLNSERCCHAVCTFDDKIYCFGGINHSNLTDKKRKFVRKSNLINEVYNPVEDVWMVIPGQPNLGLCMEAVPVGDSIFLLCETTKRSRLILRQYKPRDNEWSEIPHDFWLGHYGRFINMVGHGTKLYLFRSNKRVGVYDTVKKVWHGNFFAEVRLVTDEICVFFHSRPLITVCNDLIYIIGHRNVEENGKFRMEVAVLDPAVLNVPCYSIKRVQKMFKFKTSFLSVGDARIDSYQTATNFFRRFAQSSNADTSQFWYSAEDRQST